MNLHALDGSHLIEHAEDVHMRPCPMWLGNFSFKMWGKRYGKPPEVWLEAAQVLRQLVPNQTFNTLYLQRYEKGQQVYRHRDPRNNVGYTIIWVFGEFTGAKLTVDGRRCEVPRDHAFVLPCTINGVQGPPHSVSPVTSGTRWTFILGTTE